MVLIFQIAAGVLLAAAIVGTLWFYLGYQIEKQRSREEKIRYDGLAREREWQKTELEKTKALEEKRKAAWLAYYNDSETPEWETDLARKMGGAFGMPMAIPLDGSWPPDEAEQEQNRT